MFLELDDLISIQLVACCPSDPMSSTPMVLAAIVCVSMGAGGSLSDRYAPSLQKAEGVRHGGSCKGVNICDQKIYIAHHDLARMCSASAVKSLLHASRVLCIDHHKLCC